MREFIGDFGNILVLLKVILYIFKKKWALRVLKALLKGTFFSYKMFSRVLKQIQDVAKGIERDFQEMTRAYGKGFEWI